ncbi:MAG: 2-dehydro-3-deoxy-6-phosphogalactonate aldolase [Rhodospirillaceae bacterium]|nr:2-dehydro-3-deoxy-6-phosphogalactonate aldolase [Rhodospirillaceae bacterium]
MLSFSEALARCPLVAILRGIAPGDAEAVGATLADAGFSIIEVPMNSPRPLDSIERLARRFGSDLLIGAGTVMGADAVADVAAAGGRLIVSPHFDAAVVGATRARGLVSLPGVATPSEGFAALAAGADGLKLFPAEMLPPAIVRAWRAVFAAEVPLVPTGGITPDTMGGYWSAGVAGFGLGSALYKASFPLDDIRRRADSFMAALAALPPRP